MSPVTEYSRQTNPMYGDALQMPKSKEGKARRICVISFPLGVTQYRAKMAKILMPICDKVFMITGNISFESDLPEDSNFRLINIKAETRLTRHLPIWLSLPIWLFNYTLWQVKMAYHILKLSRDIDVVVLFIGEDLLILPLLMGKVLGKKMVKIVTESTAQWRGLRYGRFVYHALKLLERINNSLCDRIVVETESTLQWIGLESYRDKILIGGQIHTDTDLFRVILPFYRRDDVIGYIGSSTKQKGIINLVKAIPLIIAAFPKAKFIIGEKGQLSQEVGDELEQNGMSSKVTRLNWIPQEELPDYFNRLKLFVLPTYSETGIPAVVLESMACGTPVLATPVGGITDAIEDGKTGFILRENTPQQIAWDVIRVLEYPDLKQVAESARRLVETEYSYPAVLERYRNIF